MSLLVFLIAAVPGALVAWVGMSTTSAMALWGAALVAAAVGVLTGNPIYMGLDILCVGIGLYIGSVEQKRVRAKMAEEAPPPPPKAAAPAVKKSGDGDYKWVIGVVVLVAMYANWSKPSKPSVQPPPPSPPQAQTPIVRATPPVFVETPRSEPLNVPAKVEQKREVPIDVTPSYPARKEPRSAEVKRSPVENQQRAAYKNALRQIEAQHPELNPDSASYRVDLVEQAIRLKNENVAQGMALDAALVQAVATMERNSVFGQRAQDKPIASSVLDAGGHSGFDPKCRWVTSQDWTCK